MTDQHRAIDHQRQAQANLKMAQQVLALPGTETALDFGKLPATPQQALRLLIELALAEADRLSMAAKLYERNGAKCPPDVRKQARRREQVLEAVRIAQEIKLNVNP